MGALLVLFLMVYQVKLLTLTNCIKSIQSKSKTPVEESASFFLLPNKYQRFKPFNQPVLHKFPKSLDDLYLFVLWEGYEGDAPFSTRLLSSFRFFLLAFY